ncbi:hypothetical protein INR49_011150 [Caranx melampygus]|nr:hypothetical protein INR49_011150 [Caranx melampygus]
MEKWGYCLKRSPDAQNQLVAAVDMRGHQLCPLQELHIGLKRAGQHDSIITSVTVELEPEMDVDHNETSGETKSAMHTWRYRHHFTEHTWAVKPVLMPRGEGRKKNATANTSRNLSTIESEDDFFSYGPVKPAAQIQQRGVMEEIRNPSHCRSSLAEPKWPRFSQDLSQRWTLAGQTTLSRFAERSSSRRCQPGEFGSSQPGVADEGGVEGPQDGGSLLGAALCQLEESCVHPAVYQGGESGVAGVGSQQLEEEACHIGFTFDGTHVLDAKLHFQFGDCG